MYTLRILILPLQMNGPQLARQPIKHGAPQPLPSEFHVYCNFPNAHIKFSNGHYTYHVEDSPRWERQPNDIHAILPFVRYVLCTFIWQIINRPETGTESSEKQRQPTPDQQPFKCGMDQRTTEDNMREKKNIK